MRRRPCLASAAGRVAALSAALLAGGCVLPPVQGPPATDLPAAFAGAGAAVAPPAVSGDDWRSLYREPELQAVIETALAGNRDLQLAAARVLESRALVQVAQYAFLPTIDATAGSNRSRSSELSGQLPRGVDPLRTLHTAQLSASLELDVWGRLRYLTRAARLDLATLEYDRRAVEIGVVATAASGWFALLEADEELRIAQAALAAQRRFLELTQARRAAGAASGLDVNTAAAAVERTQATVAEVERRRGTLANALNLLLGRYDGPIARTPVERVAADQLPPAGLPSELLRRRPDLRAYEAALAASVDRTGAQRAAMFPTIGLTASGGTSSMELSDLFTGPARTWSFGVNVLQGVLDAQRSYVLVDVARARSDQALVQYYKAVEQAFREVADALVARSAAAAAGAARERQVGALAQAEAAALQRYKGGQVSYFEVIDAQRNLLDAQLALAQARLARRQATVDLYRAIGGGWDGAAADDTVGRVTLLPRRTP